MSVAKVIVALVVCLVAPLLGAPPPATLIERSVVECHSALGLLHMHEGFAKIDLDRGHEYIPNDELRDYEVSIDDKTGLLTKAGKPTASRDFEQILVETEGGKLYSVIMFRPYVHSSFTQGGPLRFAGTVVAERGKILQLTNGSGHYKTPWQHALRFYKKMREQGADLSETQFSIYQDLDTDKAEIQKIKDAFKAEGFDVGVRWNPR